MLYISFSLTNPWFRPNAGSTKEDYCNILLKHGSLNLENKHWELELIFDRRTLLRFELSLSFRGRDHAGIEIGGCLLGYDLGFRIYDIRHWDHQKDTWESNTSNEKDTKR
jgi:hypothetical protein